MNKANSIERPIRLARGWRDTFEYLAADPVAVIGLQNRYAVISTAPDPVNDSLTLQGTGKLNRLIKPIYAIYHSELLIVYTVQYELY